MIDVDYTISPLGNTALLVTFSNTISEQANRKVISLFNHLKDLELPDVLDVVPAYASIAIYYEVPFAYPNRDHRSYYEIISEKIGLIINESRALVSAKHRQLRIPVCYEEKFGPDLAYISREKSMPKDDMIQIHLSVTYKVYMIGFLPGFPYMAEVDNRIAISRKTSPRQHIDAGSVGIAGNQTGIYPVDSPGGWQIIGKTPLRIFDSSKENPVMFAPGDLVTFYSITEDEFKNY